MREFAYYVYDILKLESDGLDAIYEDFIVQEVGLHGLVALKRYNLIEACGVVNGRQLYTIC